ncbi:hypothetical protein [Oceanicola sp. S124]|nr:hypothetical protein [Oceanicola sp. S124]
MQASIVGSDGYFGLFERSQDTGIGLSAAPFGQQITAPAPER